MQKTTYKTWYQKNNTVLENGEKESKEGIMLKNETPRILNNGKNGHFAKAIGRQMV